ncbi:3-oxoacyl-[acyl-carrier-protein] reductase [Candidatus Aerophobetes bacterium]|uniref:3-oxoacyl-[acyl-carrier-protein] reductase n=1 Tax=Aerophobetes bacterium TaxID=2030807 RepID=A0A2A4YM56_UNCAE|nr:MAG: 3-oxoacyl-[acyl-carrier-protein] reductase [Candidatus Aerophobetes bacterium]
MKLLESKNAIVTGGTRGIGKSIAVSYAKNGANVVIFGTNEERAKQVLEEMKQVAISEDQKFEYKLVDVSSHGAIQTAIEDVYNEFGSVDILVNCAGITRDALLMRMSEEHWDDVINVNLKSAYNLCKAVVKPMLKARAGKIINITSVLGLTGSAGQVNYTSSKFGLVGFTRSLAIELAKRGICVNCIAPGFIQSDMTDKLTDAQKAEILKKVPMQKLGQPENIANAALFLASSMSDYMTGQTITVDGGMLA